MYPHITEVAKYTIVITINAFKAGSAGKFGYHKFGGEIVGIGESLEVFESKLRLVEELSFQGAV